MTVINKYILLSSILVILVSSTACTQKEMKDPNITERIEQTKEGVELFVSPDYRIVSDKNEIMELEPSVFSKSKGNIKLIDIVVRVKNEGSKKATNIDVKINEPTPFNYIQASMIGIKGSHLESNSETELRFVVAFDDDKKLASFRENVTFTISWDENNERRNINVGF